MAEDKIKVKKNTEDVNNIYALDLDFDENIDINMEMELTDNKFVSAELLENTLKGTYKELEDNGAKVDIKSKDNKVIVDINLDLDKIDSKKLKKINLYDTEESYEDAKKSFEKLGYTCK